jgi:hypothetical protein
MTAAGMPCIIRDLAVPGLASSLSLQHGGITPISSCACQVALSNANQLGTFWPRGIFSQQQHRLGLLSGENFAK